MDNSKHEASARQLLQKDNDEIIAKRLQEEDEKELELLQLTRLQEESESLGLALKLQADYSRTEENNNAGEIIILY